MNFDYYQMSTLHTTFLIMVSIYNCAIFRTLALLVTLTGVQLTRRVEASPALSEHHYCIKFSIQNIVLRVSARKNSEMFPCGASFSCFFSKCLPKFSSSTTTLLPALKNVCLCTCIQVFIKLPILNVWQFSEYICLCKCTVNCTISQKELSISSYSSVNLISVNCFQDCCLNFFNIGCFLMHKIVILSYVA